MHVKTILKKVLTVLNLTEEIKLETALLKDGATIEADAWEKDAEVFIVTDNERVPLPMGEYTLETGEMLIVVEDGIINSFAIPEEEEEKVEEKEALTEEPKGEEKAPVKKTVESVSKETFFEEMAKRIEALELALQEKQELEEKKEVELKSEPEKETEKVIHSPEKEVKQLKKVSNKPRTVQERILAKYN